MLPPKADVAAAWRSLQNGALLLVGVDAADRICGWEVEAGTGSLRPPLASAPLGGGGAEDVVLMPAQRAVAALLRGGVGPEGQCEVRYCAIRFCVDAITRYTALAVAAVSLARA